MTTPWMYRKKLKLFEIFRVVDGKEEVLAIGLDEESTQRVVEIINEKEADDEYTRTNSVPDRPSGEYHADQLALARHGTRR